MFWELFVVRSGAPFFLVLWGVSFVLIGIYIIFGRFFFEALQRGATYYGVTSERVVIVKRLPSANIRSLPLKTLSEMSFSQQAGRLGTITFGPLGPFPQWLNGSSWPNTGGIVAPSFDSIADAKAVYEVIRSAQRATT